MRISDRLRTKAARPQTPATQALVPVTATLPPSVPQTAPVFVARLPLPPQPQFIRQIAPVATVPSPPQPQFIRQIAPVATAPSPQTSQIASALSPSQLPQPVPAVNIFATTSPPQPLASVIPAIAADSPLDNQVCFPVQMSPSNISTYVSQSAIATGDGFSLFQRLHITGGRKCEMPKNASFKKKLP